MMKVLSRFIISLAFVFALSPPSMAQLNPVNTYTGKAFAKATTSTDTSATVNIGSYPFVSVTTTATGSDSSVITVTIDGYMNGVWSNLLTSQALQLGRPAGHTLASTKGQVSNFVLRDGSRIADLTQNCAQIRIRNVHSSGSADSTSALAYTQNVILRK